MDKEELLNLNNSAPSSNDITAITDCNGTVFLLISTTNDGASGLEKNPLNVASRDLKFENNRKTTGVSEMSKSVGNTVPIPPELQFINASNGETVDVDNFLITQALTSIIENSKSGSQEKHDNDTTSTDGSACNHDGNSNNHRHNSNTSQQLGSFSNLSNNHNVINDKFVVPNWAMFLRDCK